jgi:hypothetical protein
MQRRLLVTPLALLVACSSETLGPAPLVDPPSNMSYEVEPTGTPGQPSGLVLRWDYDGDPDLATWNVYSRGSTSGEFLLRGTTTSNSFHDRGAPHLQDYVTAVDQAGGESAASAVITVDERLALEAPGGLITTTLDGSIGLSWPDNAYQAEPGAFRAYHVYSASYDLDADKCGTDWGLEGTTVAPEFIAASLTNGSPRCFGVSAVSVEGFESLWSPIRSDTPRPDARNVVVYARQASSTGSAFRFWQDANADGQVQDAELGLVKAGTAADADFVVDRLGSGSLTLTPVRAGVQVTAYGVTPVGDLTDIDIAPVGGYASAAVTAAPGATFIFRMAEGDGFYRYGAVRLTHVGQDFIILDWSYQTDPGNPDLVRAAR